MSDLTLKDAILGMLSARASGPDQYKIHASDFKKVLNEMGLDWGSPLSQDIMIHCKTDSIGFIDFSGLEVQLRIEREKHDKTVSFYKYHRGPMPGAVQTTQITVPLRNAEHEKTADDYETNANQLRLANLHRQEVHEIFKDFVVKHCISPDAVIQRLQALGFITSQSFYILLNINQVSDLQFREFLRGLIACGDERTFDVNNPRAVAGIDRKSHDGIKDDIISNELFRNGKRMTWVNIEHAASEALSSSNNKQSKACGILPLTSHIEETVHSNKSGPKRDTNISGTSDIFFTNDSSKKLGMGNGLSSEQRIVREQILVAIRKLDLNEISLNDFKSRVMNLSVVISNEITKELLKYKSSGKLNTQRVIFLFDEIFTSTKVTKKEEDEQEFAKIKEKLLSSMKVSRDYDLVKLFLRMKECDIDKSGTLSLGEFISAMRSIGVTRDFMADAQVRVLFNSFETAYGGGLDHIEFITGLIGSIAQNQKRFKYVKWVFPKCDKKNQGFFTLEDLLDQVNVDSLDLLMTNECQDGEKALKKLISFFTYFESGSSAGASSSKRPSEVKVVFDVLALYFQVLSAAIDDDDTFVDGIKKLFNLTDKFPSSYSNKMNTYGDILSWEDELSKIEIEEREVTGPKSRKYVALNPYPYLDQAHIRDVIHHSNQDKNQPTAHLSAAKQAFWNTNAQSNSIFWNMQKASPQAQVSSPKKPLSLSQLAIKPSSSSTSSYDSNSMNNSNRSPSPPYASQRSKVAVTSPNSPSLSSSHSHCNPTPSANPNYPSHNYPNHPVVSPHRPKTLDAAVAEVKANPPPPPPKPNKTPTKSLADYANYRKDDS